jgi:hypothetical protein
MQMQDNWPSIMFAMAGGVVISLRTLATQYGWAYVGLSVTEVMASSLKVVIGEILWQFYKLLICCKFAASVVARTVQNLKDGMTETCLAGTTLSYFLDGRINRAEVLFPGVGCFLIAACLGSLVHSSNTADNQEKLSSNSMANRRNATG